MRGIVCGAALLLVVVGTAGCGGGSSDAHFTASTTVSCLEGHESVADVNTSVADVDVMPGSRREGLIRIKMTSGNVVTFVFGRSPEEAQQYGRAYEGLYRRFGSFTYSPVVRANVTLLWKGTPASSDLDLVERCLSEGGSAIPLEEQDPSTAESYVYAKAAYDSYVRECSANGFADKTCRCMLGWAQARYAEHAFRAAFSRKALVSAVFGSCTRSKGT